jgi:hypothetical protein
MTDDKKPTKKDFGQVCQDTCSECVNDIHKVVDAAFLEANELTLLAKLDKTRFIVKVAFYIAMVCFMVSGYELVMTIIRIL